MNDRHDEVFKALADPNRRRIMAALCKEPMVAGDLGRLVSLAPNAVSFHLRLLQEARLVSVQRQGRFLWYRIDREVLDDWQSYAQGLFTTESATESIEAQLARPPAYSPPANLKTAPPPGTSRPIHAPRIDAASQKSRPDAEPVSHDSDDKLPAELL